MIAMSWHIERSTREQSGWPPSRLLSTSVPHRWPTDHRDLERLEELGWRAEWYESVALVTSCLRKHQQHDRRKAASKAILLSTSKQILPSLSMFGWYILVRKRILGGVIG